MKIHIKKNRYGKFDWAVVSDNPKVDLMGAAYASAQGWADTKDEAEADARDAIELLSMPQDAEEWVIDVAR